MSMAADRSFPAPLGVRVAISWPTRINSGTVQPFVDLVDIETQQAAPFVKWDTTFAHEPADVSDRHCEVFGEVSMETRWRSPAVRTVAADRELSWVDI